MRRATVPQTEVQLRPFVILRANCEPNVFTLCNVGQGVALNVRVEDVRVGAFVGENLTIHFPEAIPLLCPGEGRRVGSESRRGGTPVRVPLSARLDERFASPERSTVVTVRYENVEGAHTSTTNTSVTDSSD